MASRTTATVDVCSERPRRASTSKYATPTVSTTAVHPIMTHRVSHADHACPAPSSVALQSASIVSAGVASRRPDASAPSPRFHPPHARPDGTIVAAGARASHYNTIIHWVKLNACFSHRIHSCTQSTFLTKYELYRGLTTDLVKETLDIWVRANSRFQSSL